jgi:uncharacterized lipoprotein YajG
MYLDWNLDSGIYIITHLSAKECKYNTIFAKSFNLPGAFDAFKSEIKHRLASTLSLLGTENDT